MTKHSKHYYEYNRNMSVSEKINPKMLLSKDELDVVDYSETKTPNYYIGDVFGYQAKDIIEDFDLSYNVGTCLSYILRAKRKHDSQIECIQKAINHLQFELDRLKRNEEANL